MKTYVLYQLSLGSGIMLNEIITANCYSYEEDLRIFETNMFQGNEYLITIKR